MNKRTSGPGSSSSVVHVVCPERDLAANWEVDLAKELEDNLLKICSRTITGEDEARIQVNFSEGAYYILAPWHYSSYTLKHVKALLLLSCDGFSTNGWLLLPLIAIVCGNISLRYIPVSFNQAIGATAPFFAAIFAYVMIRKTEAWVTYATLFPVVAGVIIASGGKSILLSSILVM